VAETTNQRFGSALSELLLERDYSTQTGKPNWTAFARELQGAHYETLRRAVSGEREPSPRLLEGCARVVAIDPAYFLEYRLYQARREFDPAEVGPERAARSLATWNAALGSDRRNNA
jgi:hypothetical protein